MKTKTELTAEAISRLFRNSGGYSNQQVHEIVFHLTDWNDDLRPFADFLDNPSKYGEDEAMQIIIRFLAHAPDHLKTAADIVLNPGE